VQADGAELHVGRERGGAEQLGEGPVGLAPAHVHLEQPVLGVDRPLEEEQVVAAVGEDVGEAVGVADDPGGPLKAGQPGRHRVALGGRGDRGHEQQDKGDDG
jgi:hypothetical protein